jgi:hypothetical protein
MAPGRPTTRRAVRGHARLAQQFLRVRTDTSWHPHLSMRMHGHLRGSRMKLGSPAVHWGFDAVRCGFARGSRRSNGVRRRSRGRLKRDPLRAHEPFDEPRSILIICERNGHDRATNTRRTADDRSFILSTTQMPVHARGRLWNAKMYRYAPQKNSSGEARPPPAVCSTSVDPTRRSVRLESIERPFE